MLKKHKKEILLLGIPIFLLITIIFLSFIYVNKTDFIGKASYNTLSAEQKQAYWECFKMNKCGELLAAKKNKEYRECSLSCNKQAQTATANIWCEDSDKGDNFFEKGFVKSNIYLSGKEDSCYTFLDSGKTYLFEGRCKENKYQSLQKNCGEVGKDFVCKDGTCKTKNTIFNGDGEYLIEEGDSLIANNGVTIKPIKFLDSWLVVILFDVYVGNEKINLHPVRFSPTQDATYLIDYAVKLNIISKEENKVNLSIESVEDAPVQSCVDLYNYCKGFGYSQSTCSRAYCPTKAVDTEVKLEKENIVIFVDKEYQPYGEYLLD